MIGSCGAGRYPPYAIASRASLLWLLLSSETSGDRARFLLGVEWSEETDKFLPVEVLFGL